MRIIFGQAKTGEEGFHTDMFLQVNNPTDGTAFPLEEWTPAPTLLQPPGQGTHSNTITFCNRHTGTADVFNFPAYGFGCILLHVYCHRLLNGFRRLIWHKTA